MVGRTTTFGQNLNNFTWQIPQSRALRFEKLVADAIRDRLSTLDGAVKVVQTGRSGDEGRDIEISFSEPISIGSRVFTPTSAPGLIYVECKATGAERLAEGFLADASQHETDALTAYVLATNATLTPYAHYRAEQQWARLNAGFVLMDRGRLSTWLFGGAAPSKIDADIWPKNAPIVEGGLGVCVELQHRRESLRGEHRVQSYMVVRNNDETSQRVALSTAADLSWDSDIELEAILAPGEDRTFRFESRQKVYGLNADLGLTLTRDHRSVRLSLSSSQVDLVLEPPFMGALHCRCRDDIRDAVCEARGFKLISVEGEAGIGKTRTIEEALAPLEGGRADIIRLTCEPDTGVFDFSPLLDLLDTGGAGASTREAAALTDPIEAIASIRSHPLPLILVLEDLHHCSPEGIRAIKTLALEEPIVSQPVVVIVTGRNDHTFPNADYYAFLELIRLRTDFVIPFQIAPLADIEARDLINAVAVDLPEAALSRVHNIGQSNPFVILEALQFLLDVGLARLLSRRTIGVTNPERFVGLEGLPTSVEDLYRRRLESLAETEYGQTATDLLCFLAFIGPTVDLEVLEEFFQGDDATPALSVLRRRRFLKFQPELGRVSFVHENLLHATRTWLRARVDAKAGAQRLLKRQVVRRLNVFQRADLQVIAQRYGAAFKNYAPIWGRVQAVTNFSSEEIDRSYFAYLPSLFEAATQHGESKEELSCLAVTMGYMGVHNFPLVQGEKACARASRWLDQIYSASGSGRAHKMAVRQLHAHVLQNMGRTGEALKRMLELQSEIELIGSAAPTVEYDLYDRLQEHYRRANHAKLMNNYGALAARAVQLADDERLMSAHLITQSLAKMYRGQIGAANAAARALASAKNVGVRRFVVFNLLTELVVRALYANGNVETLSGVYCEARDLLRLAAMESFSDSIIRLELLLATLSLHVHDEPSEGRRMALGYIRAAREAAVRFGIGLYDWAIENLSAVILLEVEESTDEEIRRKFGACLERLSRRGLLFIGSIDGTFPNVHAISNIIRFHATYSEKDAVRMISSRVSAYESIGGSDDSDALNLVIDALAGKAVFWPPRRLKILRYPINNGYFTPLI